MTLPVANPIIIIFERHWDEEPKKLMRDIFPALAKKGYDTFCMEASQNRSEDEIIASHRLGLEHDSSLYEQTKYLQLVKALPAENLSDMDFNRLCECLRPYNKSYKVVAEKIKQLPAVLRMGEMFKRTRELEVEVKGIDIDAWEYHAMVKGDICERVSRVDSQQEHRDTTITANLFKLRAEKMGVVYLCGSLHARNLMAKFKEKNMEKHVLYYFPHSEKNYFHGIDEVNTVLMTPTLAGHTYCLRNAGDHKALTARIIHDIQSQNVPYQEMMSGHPNAVCLSDVFKAGFKAFERPGYYVDALFDPSTTDRFAAILKKLQEVGLQTHETSMNGRTYLVVSAINTDEVAHRIKGLT